MNHDKSFDGIPNNIFPWIFSNWDENQGWMGQGFFPAGRGKGKKSSGRGGAGARQGKGKNLRVEEG